MKYRVVILPRAEQQLFEIALWWSTNRSHAQAMRWLEGIQSAIVSLSEDPQRHGLARENQLYEFPRPIRQMPFGIGTAPTHRVLFEIRDADVNVLAVRHLAQSDFVP